MTTRTLNNFKTLRELLDYNDVMERSEQIISTNEISTNRKEYTIKKSSLLAVSDWNAIYSNNKLFSCMLLMLVTILSQLVFSYIAFGLVSVKENVDMFYISQAINLIFSYLLPLSIIQGINDVLENPFSELSNEISVYKQLRNCVIAQLFCTIISMIALIKIFNGGSFTEIRFNYQEKKELSIDMTSFIKILQVISFQLTLINLILVFANYCLMNRKIRHCINRIEHLQNASDMEAMFNHEIVDERFLHDLF
jgi:hypothetical protein